MGQGNALIRSLDDERLNVTTFFGDFHTWDQTHQEYQQEYADEHDGDTISEESAMIMQAEDSERDFYNFLANAVYAAKGWEWIGIEKAQTDDKLSGEFRGTGYIVATSEHANLVVPSGCEHYHIAFGVVPNEEWGVMADEIWNEEQHKEPWYEARKLNFENRVDEIADRAYEKFVSKCNAEAVDLGRAMVKDLGDEAWSKCISTRNGAWQSSPVSKDQMINLIQC